MVICYYNEKSLLAYQKWQHYLDSKVSNSWFQMSKNNDNTEQLSMENKAIKKKGYWIHKSFKFKTANK